MIVNWGSCSKTNLVIINLLLRTHPAQQLFSSLGGIFQLLTIMIAVTNGSEGLFYGKRSTFSTGFDMDHLIYWDRGVWMNWGSVYCLPRRQKLFFSLRGSLHLKTFYFGQTIFKVCWNELEKSYLKTFKENLLLLWNNFAADDEVSVYFLRIKSLWVS